MKTRTCPHCNYKYSIPEYINYIFSKFRFLEWNCKNCNKKITIDLKRRFLVGLTFVGLYAALFSLKNAIGMTPLRWAVLFTIYVIGSFFFFTFDTFKKAE
jgi:hypothetical protein